jgi:hypothetical protein
VHGRLHNILSSLSMVYGLVFSGVAGSALSPFNVADFAEGSTERTLANFCNLAASLQFSICISGVLFTSFLLVFINAIPDTAIFRCAANFDFVMLYPYLIFYSTWLLLAQLCAVIYMKSDTGWAVATIVGSMLCFWLLFWHWIWAMRSVRHTLCTSLPLLFWHSNLQRGSTKFDRRISCDQIIAPHMVSNRARPIFLISIQTLKGR